MKTELLRRETVRPVRLAVWSTILASLCSPAFGADEKGNNGKTDVAFLSSKTSPTFTEHVAPIVFQNCVACHRPGEAAPFPLLTYQDVKKRGKQIAEVTAKKFMPPWHAELGHVEFVQPRILSDEQIATLREWHRAGMPEGDPARLPKPPQFPEGWSLGKPDLIVKMTEAYQVYAEGKDIYRNFVFPLNLPEDKWIKAIEYRPGARTVVHHALFFLDVTGKAREYDAADPEPGYKGMGRGNRQFTPVGGWAVGSNVRALPDDLAYHYPKDADLVLQTHFHPTGKAEEEISTVGLYFADKPPQRTFVGVQLPPAFGAISGVDIPAGETNYLIKDSFTLPIDVEGFAIGAHAHYLGKVMNMKATFPDGQTKWLLKVPDWDFAWQEQYAYKNRLPLPKGTKLDVEITYDNSASNPRNPTSPPKRVKWGPMSTDEMGSITVHVIPARESDAPELRKALKGHSVDLLIDRAMENPKRAGMVKGLVERFDKNADGKIDGDERAPLRTFIQESGFLGGQENNSF